MTILFAFICAITISQSSSRDAKKDKRTPEAIPKSSNLFLSNGTRIERHVPPGAEIPDKLRKESDTISGWERLSNTARSNEIRFSAISALKAIARRHATNEQKLSEAELIDCKQAAIRMIPSANTESSGLEVLLALGAADSDIPMLSGVIKSWVNQGSSDRTVPLEFRGNPAYLAIHCLSRIKSEKARTALVDLHKNVNSGDYSALIKEEIGKILDKMDGNKR